MICAVCWNEIEQHNNGNWYHLKDEPPYHFPLPKKHIDDNKKR